MCELKSNAERMSLVFARAKKIKYCRETKKLNFCKAATALLSDGTDALRSLIPTDGGDYRLSVAVISDVYAGTFIIDFSLEYSAENA